MAKQPKKWQQKVAEGIKRRGTKGALRRKLGVKKGEKIPTSRLKSIAAKLHKKAKKGKLTKSELKMSRRVGLALRFRGK